MSNASEPVASERDSGLTTGRVVDAAVEQPKTPAP